MGYKEIKNSCFIRKTNEAKIDLWLKLKLLHDVKREQRL